VQFISISLSLISLPLLEQKYTSFTRQLNIYGFRSTKSGSYFHPYFQRGKKDLLSQVVRVPVKSLATKQSKNKRVNGREPSNRPITTFNWNIPMPISSDSVPGTLQYSYYPPFFPAPMPVPCYTAYGHIPHFPPQPQYIPEQQYYYPSHSTTLPSFLSSSSNDKDFAFNHGESHHFSSSSSSSPSFDMSSSSFSPGNDTYQFYQNVQDILSSPSFDDSELA
jgi:hypothetical protein